MVALPFQSSCTICLPVALPREAGLVSEGDLPLLEVAAATLVDVLPAVGAVVGLLVAIATRNHEASYTLYNHISPFEMSNREGFLLS